MTLLRHLLVRALVLFALSAVPVAAQSPILAQFLDAVTAPDLVPGAESFGPIRSDVPVAPILQGGEIVGWAFVTSDFVGTTGYSGKPIHVMVAIGPDAVLQAVRLVKHSEPIVLIGISEARVAALTEAYTRLDIVAEAAAGGAAHDLNIISGATVTIMVIDDSVVRSSIRVARVLGLGGLVAETAPTGPRVAIDPEARYHAVHRAELPELVSLARKVESVHAEDPEVPLGIAEALAYLQHAMEDHMAKEEMILLPAMRAGGRPGIESPIAVMRHDHDDHAEEVALIRELTLHLTPPDHACGSWRRLYAGTAKFFDDLEAHIALENEVLFPRFEPAA